MIHLSQFAVDQFRLEAALRGCAGVVISYHRFDIPMLEEDGIHVEYLTREEFDAATLQQ